MQQGQVVILRLPLILSRMRTRPLCFAANIQIDFTLFPCDSARGAADYPPCLYVDALRGGW